jgi:hypothetical protein
VVVVGRILGEAWPQIAFEQLQVLEHQQRRVGKVDALQLVPQLLLDHLRAHLGRLLRGQPGLPGDLRKVVLAVQVRDRRAGVDNGRVARRAGRGSLYAVHLLHTSGCDCRGSRGAPVAGRASIAGRDGRVAECPS